MNKNWWFTDHLSILYSKMPSARVIQWRFMLEEYGADFVHVEGEDNVVANTMVCHPNSGNITEDVATSGQHMERSLYQVHSKIGWWTHTTPYFNIQE